MRNIFLSIGISLLSFIGFAQSDQITGAWIWRDSKTAVSLFIKEDGTIQKHTGPINTPIYPQNLKHGTWKLKGDNSLEIKWDDKTSEVNTVKLINNNKLKLQKITQGNPPPEVYIFGRVVDMEVAEPPPIIRH